MATIFIILIIVAGFSFISYLHYKHLLKLETLLKARDLTEAKIYEEKKKEKILPSIPEELQDAVRDKKPDEIRSMFPHSS